MAGNDRAERQLAIFETMLAMRRFEEAVYEVRQGGHFFGHYHLYIGQEATGGGAIQAVGDDAKIFTTHRNHGHVIARGGDPGAALAEILGRSGGLAGGRAGTFHLADDTIGMPHTSALVGGSVPLAAGAALAAKQAGGPGVGMALFGDGAFEEGVVFETLNLSKLWELPVIFVCENNTPGAVEKSKGGSNTSMLSADPLADVPKSLKIESHVVDGADGGAVFDVVEAAAASCRAGGGPVFIEAQTVRWPGNQQAYPILVTDVTDITMAWDEGRIPGDCNDECQEWFAEVDPVLGAARRLITDGHTDTDSISALDGRVRQRMAEAMDFALASPEPDTATALDHVLA